MIARNLRSAATVLGVAVIACFLAASSAESAGTAAAVPTTPVEVEMNEGRLIKLSGDASSVFIANPDIADVAVKSPRLVYIFGKQAGETTLYAVDRNDHMVASLKIQVNHNLSGLNDALRRVIKSGQISASSIDGAVVLNGVVTDSVDAENARRIAKRYISKDEEVLNQVRVSAPNQVNLRVTFAEVERSVIKQFGFNTDHAFSKGDFFINLFNGSIVTETLKDGSQAILLDSNVDNLVTEGRIGNFDIFGVLEALSQDNLLTILAEPNLSALSGETASFLAGGEFPIPTFTKDGIVVIFKEFGVSLSFQPTVLGGNRISMRVRPEVSELSDQGSVEINGFTFPGIRTRRTETTVEVGSGQSFAIAGLLVDSSQERLRRFPGLGDIPILGELFQSDKFQRNETELLIIVTPYLVTPIEGRFPLPTDPYVEGKAPKAQSGNLARRIYTPEVIPLNDGSPLAESPHGRPDFIVE